MTAEIGGSQDQDELRRLRFEKQAGEFWRGVFDDITDKTEREKIEAELTDYYFVLQQVPDVYMHVTGGLLSKPHYYASGVKSAADDYIDRLVEDEIADRLEDEPITDADRARLKAWSKSTQGS